MTNPRTVVHSSVLFGLALLVLVGCHRGRGDDRAAPQASERQLRHLVETAARDMPCAEATLIQQQIGDGLYAVQGCGRSREYLLLCEGRRRMCRWNPVTPVEQVAAAEMSCAQLMIAQPSPITRDVSGCGQTVQYTIGCNVAGCAWGHAAGIATVAPTVAVAPAPAPAPAPTATATGTIAVSSDPQAQLLQLASDRWTRAQACMVGQHANATLTLGADGRVTATLAEPFHGTAVEACVQGVVGDMAFTGQTAAVSVVLTL